MSRGKKNKPLKKPDVLFDRVVSILEQAWGNVVRAVNTNMVLAYWLIGREIVEEIQRGKGRAKYGEQVIQNLSARLTERYSKGFSEANLQWFRKFYLAYRERIAIPYPVGTESASPRISDPTGTESVLARKSHPAGDESMKGCSPHEEWGREE